MDFPHPGLQFQMGSYEVVYMEASEKSQLFSFLLKEFGRKIQDLRSQATQKVLSFSPNHLDNIGHTLFSNIREGGFCTLAVNGRPNWNPDNLYYKSLRSASKRGCQIEQAFLLPYMHLRHNSTLKKHIELNLAANITNHILHVGDLISDLALPLTECLDFGIWDDSIACFGIYGAEGASEGVVEWRFSNRMEDIHVLQETKDILIKEAKRIELSDDTTDSAPDLEEPMITTAPLARELATVLCKGSNVSFDDCSWYHSIWQYLRIFDMVSTPSWHTEFFLNTLHNLSNTGKYNNILISGTADYSMLAHLLWAYRNRTPQVIVLDLCETPLFLCRWYSKYSKAPIMTYCQDILTYKPDLKFDLITTDAFITRFSQEERPKLVSAWNSLLRPEGKVVTTARIEAGIILEPLGASDEQAQAFRRRANQEAKKWQGFLGISPEKIADMAYAYAKNMVSCSIKSEDEIVALFEEASFEIASLMLNEVPGEMASTIYAEFTASKI